jgi:hypothetical protein
VKDVDSDVEACFDFDLCNHVDVNDNVVVGLILVRTMYASTTGTSFSSVTTSRRRRRRIEMVRDMDNL